MRFHIMNPSKGLALVNGDDPNCLECKQPKEHVNHDNRNRFGHRYNDGKVLVDLEEVHHMLSDIRCALERVERRLCNYK